MAKVARVGQTFFNPHVCVPSYYVICYIYGKNGTKILLHNCTDSYKYEGAVVLWLSSWLAEQGVWGMNPCLAISISDIWYLLLPSGCMTEITL